MSNEIKQNTVTSVLFMISASLLIAGTPNQIDTVGAGQSVTVSLPSNVDITTSLAVPTVRSESILNTFETSIFLSGLFGNSIFLFIVITINVFWTAYPTF